MCIRDRLNSYILYFSNTLQTTSFNPKIVLIVNPWKLLLFLCNWMWLTLKSNKRKVEKQRNLSLLFRFTAVRYYITRIFMNLIHHIHLKSIFYDIIVKEKTQWLQFLADCPERAWNFLKLKSFCLFFDNPIVNRSRLLSTLS